MNMNITTRYDKYRESSNLFRCPICHSEMIFKDKNSLMCYKKHCFDISKQGYINFLTKKQSTKYTKELFECRRYIFQEKFYLPLQEQLASLIEEYRISTEKVKVLDIGCGEGYYAHELNKSVGDLDIYAIDNVKEAIVLGAKSQESIKWIVGDLANIPMQTNTLDILLNIFTPSNYKEFQRILKKNGYLIKVVPGQHYLYELRECARHQLKNKEYSNESVVKYFKNHIGYITSKRLSYQLPVNYNQLQNFIRMTPLMFNVKKDELPLDKITHVTLDFEIIIGKNQEKL